MSLSIGIFFSLMIAGLASTLPKTLTAGLRAQGVSASVATQIGHLPPVSTLFSALLGYNPIRNLLKTSGVLAKLPAKNVAALTSRQYFPNLISGPFHHGLIVVFSAAIAMSVAGALVSLLRGRQFFYAEPAASAAAPDATSDLPVPSPGPAITANGGGPAVTGGAGAAPDRGKAVPVRRLDDA
jgi:hypothetical protein